LAKPQTIKPPILNYRIGSSGDKTIDYVISSDWHYIPYSDNSLLKAMLEKARAGGYKVLGFGDIFDAIFPTDHKRSSRRTLEQAQTDGAINELMNAAEEFFAPYADLIDFLSYGNHETAAIKYNNFDPVQDLHSRLMRHRSEELARFRPILRGRYKGFLVLRFEGPGTTKRNIQSLTIRYDHGHGGSPEVSKGTISLERMYAEYVADIYAFGHIHKGLIDSTRTTTFVDGNRNIQQRPKIGIVIPALKSGEPDSRKHDDPRTPLTRNWEEEVAWTSQTNGYVRLHCDFQRDRYKIHHSTWIERL